MVGRSARRPANPIFDLPAILVLEINCAERQDRQQVPRLRRAGNCDSWWRSRLFLEWFRQPHGRPDASPSMLPCPLPAPRSPRGAKRSHRARRCGCRAPAAGAAVPSENARPRERRARAREDGRRGELERRFAQLSSDKRHTRVRTASLAGHELTRVQQPCGHPAAAIGFAESSLRQQPQALRARSLVARCMWPALPAFRSFVSRFVTGEGGVSATRANQPTNPESSQKNKLCKTANLKK